MLIIFGEYGARLAKILRVSLKFSTYLNSLKGCEMLQNRVMGANYNRKNPRFEQEQER
jgi:hypothetical protein